MQLSQQQLRHQVLPQSHNWSSGFKATPPQTCPAQVLLQAMQACYSEAAADRERNRQQQQQHRADRSEQEAAADREQNRQQQQQRRANRSEQEAAADRERNRQQRQQQRVRNKPLYKVESRVYSSADSVVRGASFQCALHMP
ncbi:hypothetical protein OEZ86_010966 [Tetradesmus obliquus]|nr:hypothetical protein OEZ86_010966 [Tetradesmus obliquus]